MTADSVRRIAAICGPTASGKSALAAALRARGLPIEVVSCDALQVYQHLEAGTAKPSAAQRALVPTHLVDVVEPTLTMSAGQWAALAQTTVSDIAARGAWPLVVGGTGLYFRALTRGLAEIPPIELGLRRELTERWHGSGGAELHAQLQAVDPDYAAQTPVANRQRVTRALEVFLATGKTLSAWHREQLPSQLSCILVVLEPDPALLARAIADRAAAMAAPLVAEVTALLAAGLSPMAPAMQALGYRDAVEVAMGRASGRDFAARLALAHQHYAKRQRTWFRSESAALRLQPEAGDTEDRLATALTAWFTPNKGTVDD